ncbi:hypothetical protein BGW37DRAFT_548246 [Umbelopsis sp. PMI_123]|nr:hypothetical protein BGW37DRAFT_548246 [Umbelopsis sp. PMI_123]
MLAIWITRWNCIKLQKEWSDLAAYNMYDTIIKPSIDHVRMQTAKKTIQRTDKFGVLSDRSMQPNQTIGVENVQILPMAKQGDLPEGRPSTDFVLKTINPLASRLIAIFDEDSGGDVDFKECIKDLAHSSEKEIDKKS